MFEIKEDMSIAVTRGDICFFDLSAVTSEGIPFSFVEGDILRLKISTKKNCEDVVLVKDYTIESDCESIVLSLTGKDTKIGPVISKPVTYWYEICLNPETNPQTLVGYDEEGAKVFLLLPEARDMNGDDLEPDDVPWVDTELDDSSSNPISNQAIAREIKRIDDTLKNKLSTTGGSMIGPISMSEQRIVNVGNPVSDGDAANKKFVSESIKKTNDETLAHMQKNYATSDEVKKLSAEATGAIPAPNTNSAVGNCLVVTAVDENGKPTAWGTANVSGTGASGVDGKNGVTFTPYVDAEGNLSWTNDGGLENPAIVNIKGYEGKDGTDGKDGEDGYTPVKGTDYLTDADKKEFEEDIKGSVPMVLYDAQDISDEQKAQARKNIGVTGEVMAEEVLTAIPKATDVQVLKAGSIVQIRKTLGNGATDTTQITLDAYDRPMIIEKDGEFTYLTWEGFE